MAFDLNSIVPDGWEVGSIDISRAPEGKEEMAWYTKITFERKRWRAKKEGKYFIVRADLRAEGYFEDGDDLDGRLHSAGNYFKTREEAEAMAEKIRSLLSREREG